MKQIMGIDIGGTNMRFALVNSKGKILKKIKTHTKANCDKKEFTQQILDGINKIYFYTLKGICEHLRDNERIGEFASIGWIASIRPTAIRSPHQHLSINSVSLTHT